MARLEAHLAERWAGRAPVARFKAAERAYLDPPEPKLDPAVAEQIVAALVAAVPPPPEQSRSAVLEAMTNGAAPATVTPLDPDATRAFVMIGDLPPEAHQAPDMVEYDPAGRRRRRDQQRAGGGEA